MANIDDILKEFGKEISEETKQYNGALRENVSRDGVRRPWDTLADEVHSSSAAAAMPEVWYASGQSVWAAIRKHEKLLLPIFGSIFVLALLLSRLIPTTYNSMVQIYAPERTDTISSRLALFTNRVEFASFPVDFKIPLGLIARSIKGDEAKNWVLKKYTAQSHPGLVDVDPQTVRAETFHTDGTELLVIQAYANHPQIAADLANLYREYLETEINTLRVEHNLKVNQWLTMTKANLDARLQDVNGQLDVITLKQINDSNSQLNSRLGEAFSEVEMKRFKLRKDLEELRRASDSGSIEQVWQVSDPAIQDLRQVDQALSTSEFSGSPQVIKERRDQIETRARQWVQTALREKTAEFAALADQSRKLQAQLDIHQRPVVTDHQRDLIRQQTDFQALADEIVKLETQLKVEATLTTNKLSVIQVARPDLSSRRPLLLLKYSGCLIVAFLLTFLVLALLQWKEARTALGSERTRGGLFGSHPNSVNPTPELGV